MLEELGIRCSLSVHLYWKGGVLSNTCISRPSLIKGTSKKGIMSPINDLIEPLKALQLSV